MLEREPHAALAAVRVLHHRAERNVAVDGCESHALHPAHRVARDRVLDLDHVRAPVGEHRAGRRNERPLRDFQDAHTFHRPVGHRVSLAPARSTVPAEQRGCLVASEHGNVGVDLAAVWEEHMRCEFELRDADATLETMGADPCLVEVPVGTGARGRDAVRAFYRDQFIPSWPDDTAVAPLSRTVDADRVVHEFVVSFTHSKPMDWWLPGVEPTGKSVTLPHVVIVGFEDGKIDYEHVYWDQASLLVQIGLLDPALVPALGSAQAPAVTNNEPSNGFIERHQQS